MKISKEKTIKIDIEELTSYVKEEIEEWVIEECYFENDDNEGNEKELVQLLEENMNKIIKKVANQLLKNLE